MQELFNFSIKKSRVLFLLFLTASCMSGKAVDICGDEYIYGTYNVNGVCAETCKTQGGWNGTDIISCPPVQFLLTDNTG